MRQLSERHQGATERTIKDIRRRTRKRYSSEFDGQKISSTLIFGEGVRVITSCRSPLAAASCVVVIHAPTGLVGHTQLLKKQSAE